MTPLIVIQAIVEFLKAWNALKQEQRDKLVDMYVADVTKFRTGWDKFIALFPPAQ